MSRRALACAFCRHYDPEEMVDNSSYGSRPTCAAFPDGIPPEILAGQVYHFDPRPDDQGIQYEPARAPDPLAAVRAARKTLDVADE